MQGTLDAILRRFVSVGRLTVRWPDGQRTTYAGPPESGPSAGIAIADAHTIRRLVLNPTLSVNSGVCETQLVDFESAIYGGDVRPGCVAFSLPAHAKIAAVVFSPHSNAAKAVRWR